MYNMNSKSGFAEGSFMCEWKPGVNMGLIDFGSSPLFLFVKPWLGRLLELLQYSVNHLKEKHIP